MDACRVDYSVQHAYQARQAFLRSIQAGEAAVNLAAAALHIAEEDDALGEVGCGVAGAGIGLACLGLAWRGLAWLAGCLVFLCSCTETDPGWAGTCRGACLDACRARCALLPS